METVNRTGTHEPITRRVDGNDMPRKIRHKLLTAIELLKNAVAKERQSKYMLRVELCEEMMKIFEQFQANCKESARQREKILDDKNERKMQIYTESFTWKHHAANVMFWNIQYQY